jgi:hypothetical protein
MDDVHHFGSKTEIHEKNPWNLKHRGRRKVMNLGGEWGERYLMGQKLKELLRKPINGSCQNVRYAQNPPSYAYSLPCQKLNTCIMPLYSMIVILFTILFPKHIIISKVFFSLLLFLLCQSYQLELSIGLCIYM